MPFIDLHCHIMPGVDDGATSFEETLGMLRLAHAGGTRAVVATPHFFLPPYDNSDPTLISHVFVRLLEHLEEAAPDQGDQGDQGRNFGFLREMTFYLGAENYISPEFFDALEKGDVLALNSGRYILIEFPPFLPFEAAFSAVERILHAGFFPVLAHVERYPFFQKGAKRLAGFLEMGCVAQLNASTLLGSAGRGPAKLAHMWLDKGLIQVIASDGHGLRARRPDLGEAAAALMKSQPAERINIWMWENAARILENKAPVR